MKLKYKLYVEGTTVHFEVLAMDKRFLNRSFTTDSGFDVGSEDRVEMSSYDELFLCGNQDFPHGSDSYDCDSAVEAHQLAATIHEALEDWAENWEGWKEEKEVVKDDPNVFVLD